MNITQQAFLLKCSVDAANVNINFMPVQKDEFLAAGGQHFQTKDVHYLSALLCHILNKSSFGLFFF